MNKIVKRIGVILFVIAVLCVTCMVTPTFGYQIPFNEWAWKHHPVHKIRYFMSESLVKKLNEEKPSIGQTAEMLGQEMMGGNIIQQGDTFVCYFLKTGPSVIMGLDMYTLNIYFDKDGAFKSAEVVFSD